jgi:hypothetical protein
MTPELEMVATSSARRPGDWRPRGSYQLLYDAPRKPGGDDEDHSRGHVAQDGPVNHHCAYSAATRHSSTTPHLTTTWAQDHDDNHAQTCATRRRSLQAKLASTLPQAHNPSVGRTFFFVPAPAPNSI